MQRAARPAGVVKSSAGCKRASVETLQMRRPRGISQSQRVQEISVETSKSRDLNGIREGEFPFSRRC